MRYRRTARRSRKTNPKGEPGGKQMAERSGSDHYQRRPGGAGWRRADSGRLRHDVETLTSIRPPRNADHPEALNEAVGYIESALQEAGWNAQRQPYRCAGDEYSNVIAKVEPPQTAKTVVVGAHYDVCGNTPGADDNASGVAGLLELARLIAEELNSGKLALTKPLELVAFCLEEPPFFGTEYMGSAVHAASLAREGVPVELMLCLEMIGYFRQEPGSQHYPNPQLAERYPDQGDFIVLVGREQETALVEQVHRIMAAAGTVPVEWVCFPEHAELAQRSDHINYWLRGYPAIMVNDTSFLRNPHYHALSDTADTLNYPYLAGTVDALLHLLRALVAK